MKTEFGDTLHKDLGTIAVALFAASAALIARADPADGLHLIAIVLGLLAFTFVGIAIWLYRFHMREVKQEADANRTLLREQQNLREVPRLEGHWSYEVNNSSAKNQKQMHSGRCEIKPDFSGAPRSFKLFGTRLKHWDEGAEPSACNIHWESTWCEFTDEGNLRLAYEISFEDEKLEGFAKLTPSGVPKVSVLQGNYSLYGPDGNRRTKGTITFKRDRR